MTRLALVVVCLGGCFSNSGDNGSNGGNCPPSYTIDTGASVTYTVGVDAGIYLAYVAGGHWHFEWTCDTKLSAIGCDFRGTIDATTPPGGANASCYKCEAGEDSLTSTPIGSQTHITFDTLTSTGIDGVDFDSVAGDTIQVDFAINGVPQNDLVLIPSGGTVISPVCEPATIAPSSP